METKGSLKIFLTLAEFAPDWDGSASLDWLSARERQILDGLRFAKRRREWLNGRWAAKMLLLNSLPELGGVEPSSLTIDHQPEGAPKVFFGGKQLDLSLSISHRDHLAFCGLCAGPNGSLGADVEKIEPRDEVFAADYFTREERAQLDRVAGGDRDLWVTLIWSAKEAALKALGKGLRLDTRSVEIFEFSNGAIDWGDFSVRTRHAETGAWRGWWQVKEGYVLTLALLCPREMVEHAALESKVLNISGERID